MSGNDWLFNLAIFGAAVAVLALLLLWWF